MGHRGAVCATITRDKKDPHSGPNVDAQVGESAQGGVVVKVKTLPSYPPIFTFHRKPCYYLGRLLAESELS